MVLLIRISLMTHEIEHLFSVLWPFCEVPACGRWDGVRSGQSSVSESGVSPGQIWVRDPHRILETALTKWKHFRTYPPHTPLSGLRGK